MSKGWGPTVLDEIRKGELTYAQAMLRAPYASQRVKAKWRAAELYAITLRAEREYRAGRAAGTTP